jgi:hypothetical protein
LIFSESPFFQRPQAARVFSIDVRKFAGSFMRPDGSLPANCDSIYARKSRLVWARPGAPSRTPVTRIVLSLLHGVFGCAEQQGEFLMLANIFSGLKKALSTTLGFCWGVFDFMLSAPARLFASATEPAAPHIVNLPTIRAEKSTAISAAEVNQSLRRESQVVFTYAGGCMLSKARLATPSKLSSAVKAWLAGLNSNELQKLTDAGLNGIFEHLKTARLIAGVRSVQPLPPRELDFGPPEADPEDGFAMLMHEIRNTGPNSC